MATIVVEAGERSGALITAEFAVQQGREVLACTVSPTNSAGGGVRRMLRDGAPMIVDVEHALELLVPLAVAQGYAAVTPEARRETAIREMDGEMRQVFDAVTEDTTADDVALSTGLPIGRVLALLSELGLDGLLADDGGGRWRRADT